MVHSNRDGAFGLNSILGAEDRGRPISATSNIRRVGMTERPDVIAVRFYFEKSEHLFKLAEPSSGATEDLKILLKTVAELENGASLSSLSGGSPYSELSEYVGDLVDLSMQTSNDAENKDGEDIQEKMRPGLRDEINDIWKAWQSLQHVTDWILSSGVLRLTPVARPLIQISVELQDVLFGRRDGSLLRARHVIRVKRRSHPSEVRKILKAEPVHAAADQLTPFQALIASLAASTSKIDNQDEALWLEACSQSLEAVIDYLTRQSFLPRMLGPLINLAQALREELSGKASNFFEDHLYENRHGPELSPSKPPRLSRLYFNLLLIDAREDFKNMRRHKLIKLKKSWLDEQLRLLSLRDEAGNVITLETVRRLDRRQVDDPGSDSESFRYRQAVSNASRKFLREAHLFGRVEKPLPFAIFADGQEHPLSAPPPEFSVQALLQAALLYEPRHLLKGSGKRANAERR